MQEKYWCSAFSSVWKLPTGFILEVIAEAKYQLKVSFKYSNSFESLFLSPKKEKKYIEGELKTVFLWQSEEIFTGAVREVKEETGVRLKAIFLFSL